MLNTRSFKTILLETLERATRKISIAHDKNITKALLRVTLTYFLFFCNILQEVKPLAITLRAGHIAIAFIKNNETIFCPKFKIF